MGYVAGVLERDPARPQFRHDHSIARIFAVCSPITVARCRSVRKLQRLK
jgi:hypothetical protein